MKVKRKWKFGIVSVFMAAMFMVVSCVPAFAGGVQNVELNAYAGSKPLLLQGAMDLEMQDMAKALENPETVELNHYCYVKGTLNGYPVVVSRTEQGEANAAASTALAMEYFDPIAVINQGTSGGHDPDLHTFDIVIGKQSIPMSAWKSTPSAQGAGVDYRGISLNGVYAYDKAAGAFTQATAYPADATLLQTAQSLASSYTEGKAVTGTIGTSDEWNNQVDRMLFLHEKFGTSVEEMETDAVAQICKTYDVPFLGIRILSNTGIYGESFNPKTGAACQNFVLSTARKYIADTLQASSTPVKASITLQDGTTKTPSPDDVIEIPQSSTFTVKFTSEELLDKFNFTTGNGKAIATGTIKTWDPATKTGIYTLYGLGAPDGSDNAAGVYVNGQKLFSMKITRRPLTSDTTVAFSKKVGQEYVFYVKPDDPNATYTFNTANGDALQTSIVKGAYPDAQGRYFCRLKVIKPVGSVGVYCNINGNTYKLFSVTCEQ